MRRVPAWTFAVVSMCPMPAGAQSVTLQHGDVVLIEYVPDKGTSVRVNRAMAVAGASHELMLAFLDHWLGQRPVSEGLKRALLGS